MRTRTAPSPFAVAAIVVTLVAVTAWAPVALACSCMAPGPPAEERESADAVFCGEVVAAEPTQRQTDYGNLQQVRVEIALGSVWKGVPEGETVELWTGSGGGDCGYHFEVGEDYLVYAYEGDDGSLSTGICSRTRPLADAETDLAALGAPERKVEP